MTKITKEQYEFALARVEELLPLVDDSTPANDKSMVELSVTVSYTHLTLPTT